MKPKTAEKSDSTEPKRQNESTRERVLEAAFTLFSEQRYDIVPKASRNVENQPISS
jgi:hypothetical protein